MESEAGKDLGPVIGLPSVNRHTPVKTVPRRTTYAGGHKSEFGREQQQSTCFNGKSVTLWDGME